MSSTRSIIEASMKALVPTELAKELLDEFDELNHRYYLGDFRPSELSGGRFSEAAFRICEQICFGNYTPISKTLPKIDDLIRKLESTPDAQADTTFRIHIPRTLRLIYDLRNKRDVAHLGSSISPNFTDASLVLMSVSWVVSEIVRVSHKCSIQEAQRIVNSLVQRRSPLIWEEEDFVRVLDPSLPFRDQVLLILHHFQPQWIDEQKLFDSVEYSNISVFRKNILNSLHKEALIQYKSRKAKILPTGNKYVEEVLHPKH
jgi:hypothetical protein